MTGTTKTTNAAQKSGTSKGAAGNKAGAKRALDKLTGGKPRGTLNFLQGLDVGGEGRQTLRIRLENLIPDPDQPRSAFRPIDGVVSEETLQRLYEMADSLRAVGQIQPILIRPNEEAGPGHYYIVAGERRWRGFMHNQAEGYEGFDEIECLLTESQISATTRLVQLAENLQREDLTDLEVAAYLQFVMTEYPDLQQKDLAELLNKKKQWVSRVLALLDPAYAELVQCGAITYATILEQFKALDKPAQDRLRAEALASGQKITSGHIRTAKNGGVADTSSGAGTAKAESGSVPPPVATEVKQTFAKVGGTTPAVQQQEIKVRMSQLARLVPLIDPGEQQARVVLSVAEMRTALKKLGVKAPGNDMHVGQALVEALAKAGS